MHHTAFLHLKEAITQAPILHYPNPDKSTLCTQMPLTMHAEHNSLKYDGMEFPLAFFSHTFRDSKEMEHNCTRGLWSLLCNY